MTVPELVSFVFTVHDLRLPKRQERMYILDNAIWFISFIFLNFNPNALLAKQGNVKFNHCCERRKNPGLACKTWISKKTL